MKQLEKTPIYDYRITPTVAKQMDLSQVIVIETLD
jgi:hypothetical protein